VETAGSDTSCSKRDWFAGRVYDSFSAKSTPTNPGSQRMSSWSCSHGKQRGRSDSDCDIAIISKQEWPDQVGCCRRKKEMLICARVKIPQHVEKRRAGVVNERYSNWRGVCLHVRRKDARRQVHTLTGHDTWVRGWREALESEELTERARSHWTVTRRLGGRTRRARSQRFRSASVKE